MTVDPRFLVEYHGWAWPRFLEDLRKLSNEQLNQPAMIAGGSGDGSIMATVTHSVRSDNMWLRRWQGEYNPVIERPDYADVEELAAARAAMDEKLLAFSRSLTDADLTKRLNYHNAAFKQDQSQLLWRSMLHLQLHSSHHRAEASVALTGMGVSPQSVDIFDYYKVIPDA